MRCYFHAHKSGQPDNRTHAVVAFSIPELDISFRAGFEGTQAECDYAGLLALLEFVELNPQLFRDKSLQIYGDNFTVVNQINDQMLTRKPLDGFKRLAKQYQAKIPYTLGWVAREDNPALIEPR